MIKRESLDGGLVKTYSDLGVYIHGGYPEADYEEAIDPVELNRQYTETDTPIPSKEATAEEALDILLGAQP